MLLQTKLFMWVMSVSLNDSETVTVLIYKHKIKFTISISD
jgi:hypothetical protein